MMLRRWPTAVFNTPEPGAGATPPPPATGAAAPTPVAPSAATGAAATPPEGLPVELWDTEKGSVKVDDLTKHYLDLNKFKSEHDERTKTDPRPESADKYELALPKDFKLPDGVQIDQVKFDPANPLIASFREWAHAKGIGQATFSELLGQQAQFLVDLNKRQVSEYAQQREAETQKLGANAAGRRTAIDTWVKAQGFADDEVSEVRLLTATEAGVRALERVIQAANGTRMPGRPADPTPPAPPAKPTEQVLYPSMQQRA